MMKITMPRNFKEWGIWIAIFSFVFDKIIKLFRFLFNSRGSSYETKKDLEKMEKDIEERFIKSEEDNEKRHKETKEWINEVKDSFGVSFEKLVSKESLELQMEALRKEIKNDNELNFLRIQAIADKSIEEAKEAKIEHRTGKRRNEEMFLEVSKKIEELDKKMKKNEK